jgi:hypothetical protein
MTIEITFFLLGLGIFSLGFMIGNSIGYHRCLHDIIDLLDRFKKDQKEINNDNTPIS